jgi:uncharacterized protein (TIGR03067 family)
MRLIPVLFLTVSAAVAAADAKDDPAAKELARLQGTWKMVSLERDGRVFEYPEGSQPRWLVKGNRLLNAADEKEFATIVVDPSTTPKLLDQMRTGAKSAAEAIYTLDGDTWTVCINTQTDGARERPTDFATKGKANWKVWTLHREKP